MNKITKAITASAIGIALALGGSVAANAADSYVDLGSPYLTHGELGYSHVRGGDWAITSIAKGDSFGSYNAPLTMRSTLTEGKTIERMRLTFTPDAEFAGQPLVDEFNSESADLTPGSTWFRGFVVGSSQVLNGKVVVHVFRIING